MRSSYLILFLLFAECINAQTLGGSSVYNFLKLSNTPQLSALGGINISNQTNDIGLVFNNPALLRNEMHTQLNIVFNSFYGGIKNYHLLQGYHHSKLNTSFATGVNFFNYGNIRETDASGNVLGNFKPVDYVIHFSASRKYEERWYYGGTIKFIHSNYGQYRSSGVALDLGVTYADTAALLQFAFVLKNMGSQLKKYSGTRADDLPFDMQIGISKKLSKAPIQFSLTAHHLHRFDIVYNDVDYNENGVASNSKKFTFDKLFRHIVLSTQIYVGDKIEITAGYNYLRRKELNIGKTGNGLNGFSMGVGVLFKKMQIRFARSHYQNNSAFHQLGLNLQLKEVFRKS